MAKVLIVIFVFAYGTMQAVLFFSQPLKLFSFVPGFGVSIAIVVSLISFGTMMLLLMFKRHVKLILVLSAVGALTPAIVLGISFVALLLGMVPPLYGVLIVLYVFLGVEFLTDGISRTGRWVLHGFRNIGSGSLSSTGDRFIGHLVGAFEVAVYPEAYTMNDNGQDRWDVFEPFRNIVRGMNIGEAYVGLRIERVHGRTRILYFTLALDNKELTRQLDLLESHLTANVSTFRFVKCERLNNLKEWSWKLGAVAHISGEPLTVEDKRQRPDPLTVVAKRLQRLDDGVIQVFAAPSSHTLFKALMRKWKESKYRTKLAESRVTVSSRKSGLFSGTSEESITQVDLTRSGDAGRLYSEVERLSANHACELWINTACSGMTKIEAVNEAKGLAEVLRSSIIAADPKKDLQIKVSTRTEDIEHITEFNPVGKRTLLTHDEASPLFVLPRCDVGIKMSRREAFSTASTPMQDGSLEAETMPRTLHNEPDGLWCWTFENAALLGRTLREDGTQIGKSFVWITPDDLVVHVGIFGLPRQGKTITALLLSAQLIREGIFPIVLVPAKSHEWRILKDVEPRIRVFTAGNPEVAPLRVNPWQPPPGVPLSKWVQRLREVISAWLPNDDVILMHLDDGIHTLYRNCGWSIEDNSHGRPILMSDFYDAVIEVAEGFDYGPEVRQNLYGALKSRVKSMFRHPALIDIFNTPTGLSFSELFKYPTIIEMETLSSTNQRLVAGILTAGISEYRLANPLKKISNVLIIEEAHKLLKEPRHSSRFGPSSHEITIENFEEML
ncbi:MAG: hypothetical protein ACXAEN_24745, partial [Candidatus Thorarchaeota archaeon]